MNARRDRRAHVREMERSAEAPAEGAGEIPVQRFEGAAIRRSGPGIGDTSIFRGLLQDTRGGGDVAPSGSGGVTTTPGCTVVRTVRECNTYVALVIGRFTGPAFSGVGYVSNYTPVWRVDDVTTYCSDGTSTLDTDTTFEGLYDLTWGMNPLTATVRGNAPNFVQRFVYFFAGRIIPITCEQWAAGQTPSDPRWGPRYA